MRLIRRTFSVLSELSTECTGLTLQEISQRTDIPVGSVHRLLGVLSSEHLVIRCSSTRRYFVGPAVATIGLAAVKGRRLQQEAPAPLLDAACESEETFYLNELADANHATCVAAAYGRRLTRPPALLGREFSLGTSPSTRVLLADMHHDFVSKAVRRNIPKMEVDETIARVLSIRRSGFDSAPGEPQDGLWTLSVPLPPRPGLPPWSLSVVASVRRARRPSTRLTLLHLVTALADTLTADQAREREAAAAADTVMHTSESRSQERVRVAGAV